MSTKEKILEACLNLFSKQGIQATSLNNIAKEVNIKKPSIYNHFESKDKMIEELFSYYLALSKENTSLDNEFIKGLIKENTLEMLEKIITDKQIYRKQNVSKFWKLVFSEQYHNKYAFEIKKEEEKNQIEKTIQLIKYLVSENRIIALEENDLRSLARAYAYLGHSYHLNCILDESYQSNISSEMEFKSMLKILFKPYLKEC